MQKLYCKIAIKILNEEEWDKIVKIHFSERFLLSFPKKRTERYKKSVVPHLENDFRSIYDMEEEIEFHKLQKESIDGLIENLETKNSDSSAYIDIFFLEKITEMFFEDKRDEAWKNISDQFTKSNSEARKFLKTVINIARFVDYRIFAILIDEIDQIPQNELKMLLGELTIFIEESGVKAPPPHLLFILSYTPKPELLSPFYERRLGLRMGLERISKEDTKEMVIDYLNEARSSGKSFEPLEPFDNESIVNIWERCKGGQIADILKCCFWAVEETANRGLRPIDVLSEVPKDMDLEFQLNQEPPKENSIPLKPSKLDRERVLSLFDSKKRNAERSKLLEDAVRALCKAQKNYPLNSVVIKSVADKKRRLETKGGKKKSREVDIYLTRQRDKGPEEIVDIEIKAYDRKNGDFVHLSELEGSFELLQKNLIDKLIIFTVTYLDIEVLNKMRGFGQRAMKCQINEDQLAQLLYSTDKSFFGRDLRQEEAKQVLEDIGLLESLR